MPKHESLEEMAERKEREARERQMREALEQMQKDQQALIKDGPKGTAVDGPQHYNGYQPLEAICDASPGMALGFCLGNAVKYILRAEKKGKKQEDLEKAKFYIDWYLDHYDEYVDA